MTEKKIDINGKKQNVEKINVITCNTKKNKRKWKENNNESMIRESIKVVERKIGEN